MIGHTEVGGKVAWHESVFRCSGAPIGMPVAVSQIRAVLSRPPVTKVLLSGLKAMARMCRSWTNTWREISGRQTARKARMVCSGVRSLSFAAWGSNGAQAAIADDGSPW